MLDVNPAVNEAKTLPKLIYFCLAWVASYKASFFNIQIYTYTVYVCVQILRYDYTYTIVSKFR